MGNKAPLGNAGVVREAGVGAHLVLCETNHNETVGVIDGVISSLFMSWLIFTACF